MIARHSRKRSVEEPTVKSYLESPLKDYTLLIGVVNLVILAAAVHLEKKGRNPVDLSKRELLLAGLAVHKLARLVAKDKVMQPLREPFAEVEKETGSSEVDSVERGSGLRRSIGELVTCPFCMSSWVAAGFLAGYAYRPGITRAFVWVLGMTNISHFLNQGYAKLKKLNE